MMDCKKEKYRQLTNCSCNMVRKSARQITQFYDTALREVGIKSTQFSILAALANTGAVPLTRLAKTVELERTGLTRNLNILNRNGWVTIEAGKDDARQRVIALSKKGYEKLDHAIPYWQKAQHKMNSEIGLNAMSELQKTLSHVNSVTGT